MESIEASNQSTRQRILLVVHCFDANYSMESRLSWIRANQAAEHYDTTLICAEPTEGLACDVDAQIPGLRIVTVAHTAFEKALIRSREGFYLAYRMWHSRVAKLAKKLHEEEPFALVHQLSYCGYREPGSCWKLGTPFVWGPIGGTQNVPWKFLTQLDSLGAMKEGTRTLLNTIQLNFDWRVGRVLRTAQAVYAANGEVKESFQEARGVRLPCQLETGLYQVSKTRKPLRDPKNPLRILWAGRLESWKALPLLLRAIARVPRTVPLQVRVLGSGSRETHWKKLASRLKVADRVEWVPLPEYGSREEHYRWADVLAFTSLRDTSGTGLLEALAAGVPIVGLDHQGARDIMTTDCAMPIPVESPDQVINAMGKAFADLATDPQKLMQLSDGALCRAADFHWDRLGEEMMRCYDRVLQNSASPAQKKASNRDLRRSQAAVPLQSTLGMTD